MTARTRTWVVRASAWGLLTFVAAAPAYWSLHQLFATRRGLWLLLLVACVFVAAHGITAQFGGERPSPDLIDDETDALLVSGGAS